MNSFIPKYLRPVFAGLSLLSVICANAAGGRTARQIAAELDASEPLASSVWGMLAVTAGGDTLACINPSRRLVPASNMKLLTTGAALLSLGRDRRTYTALSYDGEVKDSLLTGNLYIIGGADPSIGTIFDYLPYPEKHFSRWAGALGDSGIKRIEGGVIGDGSLFRDIPFHDDWGEDDRQSKDGVMPSGLAFRGKKCDSLPDGPLSCAFRFRRYLLEHGITVLGEYAQGHSDSLKLLRSFDGPSVAETVILANTHSDNYSAETLIRLLGLELEGASDYRHSTKALKKAMSEIGLGCAASGMRFADGSGLSRKNYVSPSFLVSFLKALRYSSVWDSYLNSLPYPGTGTLEKRFCGIPEDTAARIRAKSGTMTGIHCLSGYILPSGEDSSKTVMFSIMVNNAVASTSSVRELIDSLVLALASEN